MPPATVADVHIDHISATALRVCFTGAWRVRERLPSADEVEQTLIRRSDVQRIVLDARDVADWDSTLVSFVLHLLRFAQRRGLTVDGTGLPSGVNRLIALATAVPEKLPPRPEPPASWLARVGLAVLTAGGSGLAFLRFLGDAALALARFAAGRGNFRWIDLGDTLQACGPAALPIVSLISFLVGLILAFMGAVQLRSFGAQVYVADLVAIATTREMGCLMTAVIMAGRTGAAFAAQLGTMRVNEEIDALQTMGIPAMDFLVLPRLLALILMMPLLTIYSDLLAILGGGVAALLALDVSAAQYLERTLHALTLRDIALGIVKGTVFGVLVTLSGCLRGMQAGRSAAAVGLAATSAVVTAIVLIVVTEGLFAVVLDALGL